MNGWRTTTKKKKPERKERILCDAGPSSGRRRGRERGGRKEDLTGIPNISPDVSGGEKRAETHTPIFRS